MYYDIRNTWTDGVSLTVSDADFVLVDSAQCVTQMSASRQVGGALPEITAFKLASGSDLIDAGVDVGLPYNGSGVDIGYAEYGEYVASDATDIISFTLSSQTGSAVINSINHTVSIEVEYGTNVTSLSPTIGLSYGATINPTSGTARNFTSPVEYTVTAEDEITEQVWTITVLIADEVATEHPGIVGDQIIIHNGVIIKI